MWLLISVGLLLIAVVAYLVSKNDIIGNYVDLLFTWHSLYLNELKWKYLARCRPKRIILIRHGQSEGNIDRTVYSCVADNKIQLTQNGIDQATACGQKLRNIINNPNAKIVAYYSPFKRCKQTLKYILHAFNTDLDVNTGKLSLLNEINDTQHKDRNRNRNKKDKNGKNASNTLIHLSRDMSNYLKTTFGETPENNLTSFNKYIFDNSQIARVIEDPRLREQEWGNLQPKQTHTNNTTLTTRIQNGKTVENTKNSQNSNDSNDENMNLSDSEDVGINTKELRNKIGRFYFRFETGESGCDVYDRVSGFIASMFRHFQFGMFSKQYKFIHCSNNNSNNNCSNYDNYNSYNDYNKNGGNSLSSLSNVFSGNNNNNVGNNFLGSINGENNIEWNVIIVSHGLTMRIFLQRFFHWSVEKFETIWNFKNCQICILEKSNNGRYNMITPLPDRPH